MKKTTPCKACKQEISISTWKCPHCGKKLPTIGKKETIIIAVVAILAFSGAIIDGLETANAPLEKKLATINAKRPVSDDDITINRFRYLLESISERTGSTQEEVANMSVYGQKQLAEKYGREVSLLEFMETAHYSVSNVDYRMEYAEVVSMLVIIMSN
ncbi:MAG: hypothetical protein JXR40_06910 [Pontiellaceae bacterium]|nr:hypothetical protein [Pontiellaceae bacterium]